MTCRSSIPVASDAGRRVVATDGFSLIEARYRLPVAGGRHSHRGDVIAFALNGSATLAWGRKSEACSSLGLSIIPADVEHAHSTSPGTRCLILECGSGRPNQRGKRSLFREIRILNRGMIDFGLWLNRELAHGDDLTPLALETWVGDLSEAVDGGYALGAERSAPRWLLRIRDVMHARFSERLRVGELAAEADVHPVYLVRAFRRHFGSPPAAYLRRLRLAHAAQALVETTDPLSRVALRSGFTDQSQFTRHFTRRSGQSPGSFRAAGTLE